VVQEPAHVLYRLPNVSSQLGGGVAEDVDASGMYSGKSEVALQVTIEGAAGQSFAVVRA